MNCISLKVTVETEFLLFNKPTDVAAQMSKKKITKFKKNTTEIILSVKNIYKL